MHPRPNNSRTPTDQPNRHHVSTASGRAWQERRAAGRCLVTGCDAARYRSPAGWVNTRCREHEAEIQRSRYAAAHPAYQPRPAGRGSRLAS